jgi:ParB/RepB/Spo0J family partition protein
MVTKPSHIRARSDTGAAERQRRTQANAATLTAVTPSFASVPLTSIIDNPSQPRKSPAEIDELVASIREVGVLQPVVLVPLAIYNAAPDSIVIEHAAPGIQYVISFGHCRVACARRAGHTHIPAVIRTEYGGRHAELAKMATENISRTGLTPMEEARVFGELLSRPGMSLRKMEPLVGVNYLYVRRRNLLLSLPDSLQAKVDTGELSPHAGEVLAAVKDHALIERAYALMTDADSPARTAADAVALVNEQLEQEANSVRSMALLEKSGVRIVDPAAEWGKRAGDHLIEHGGDKPRHLARCLAAAIAPDDGLIDWYCIDREHLGVRNITAESRAAARRRAAAAAERTHDYPGEPGAAYVLAAAMLALLPPGPVLKLALQWAMPVPSLGVTEDLVNADDAKALAFVDGLSGGARVRFAFIAAVAREEVAARRTTWDRRQELYLRWLIADGKYEPTSWEREQLDALAMEGEVL